jgi:2-oxoisovalerate dehydrogenase E2 component (dihydrolipoyl transacylase)
MVSNTTISTENIHTFTFCLPDPGEGLACAEIIEWAVAEGTHVTTDQHVLSVETAKATVEIPSPVTGKISRFIAVVGEVVPVGAPLVEFEIDSTEQAGVVHLVGRVTDAPEAPTLALVQKPAGATAKATPAIRRLARSLSVSLADVSGTGVGGQITVADVEAVATRKGNAG